MPAVLDKRPPEDDEVRCAYCGGRTEQRSVQLDSDIRVCTVCHRPTKVKP